VRRRKSTAGAATEAARMPPHPDAEFAIGLERLLDGIEALVRARA
jgi:hypothetical protein